MEIIYLGCNGFPYGMAQVERQKLLAKSLTRIGHHVTVINRKGVNEPAFIKISSKGRYEGIDYIYASGSAYRSNSFVIRNLLKVVGASFEFFSIAKIKFTSGIDAALLTTMRYSSLRYYTYLSKLFRFKIILDYVELNSSLTTYAGKRPGKDFLLFENYIAKLPDSLICISNYLLNQALQQNPNITVLKIPAVCDFEKIDGIEKTDSKENYFLYCGSILYMEVIEFILQSYKVCNADDFGLYFVVNGGGSKMAYFQELVKNHPKSKGIKILSKLSFDELISQYKNANALLIPLRPTTQDEARFPHKIGEYTASARPIITTLHGEITHYFKDLENALIAKEYTPEAFAEKMEFVIQNPKLADKIGENGKQMCLTSFDYRLYGDKIHQLMS